jgi:hypothetical protein
VTGGTLLTIFLDLKSTILINNAQTSNFFSEVKFMKKQKIEREAVWLKLPKGDKDLLQSKADTARMSLSQYVMHIAENKEIVVIDGLDLYITQIKSIGNNLNQLIKLSNSGGAGLQVLVTVGKYISEIMDVAQNAEKLPEKALAEYHKSNPTNAKLDEMYAFLKLKLGE